MSAYTNVRKSEINLFIVRDGCAEGLKPENCSKHDKQRLLVFKMKFEIFFIEAQDPFHNYTTYLEGAFTKSKIHFSAFPPLIHSLLEKRSYLLPLLLFMIYQKLEVTFIACIYCEISS